MTAPVVGVCRFCGCKEESRCYLSTSDTCCWIDSARTVCSAPSCIKAYGKAQREHAYATRTRKRTPAQVHELIQQERRDQRRRNRKAGAA